MNNSEPQAHGARMRIPRSRGATSGILLILLGLWGALIPFFGHHFNFAYTTDAGWTWTAGQAWLQVLPGLVTALGGVLLVVSENRATAMLGGWLTVVAGAWFVVGRALAAPLRIGEPVGQAEAGTAARELAYFSGIGTVIVLLGALALGRLSVRSQRDIQFAQRPVAAQQEHRDVAETQRSGESAEPRGDGGQGWRRLINWRRSTAAH